MIKPGEFRFTVDQLDAIIYSSNRVAYIFEDCKEIASQKMVVQKDEYRYNQMIGGFKLSQKSFWDSANTYSVFYLQLISNMVVRIKNQYNITFDQFLEEQFIEFSPLLYSQMQDFQAENPTTRLGNKRATWSEIDAIVSELNTSKYSNIRMTWNFIGSKNDD